MEANDYQKPLPLKEQLEIASKQIKLMLSCQGNLNAKSDKNWKTKNHLYYRSIWTECAKLLDYYSWQRGAVTETDFNQIKLGLVNIWRLLLSRKLSASSMLMEDDLDEITNVILEAYHNSRIMLRGNVEFCALVERMAEFALKKEPRFLLFFELIRSVNLDLDELFNLYRGK